MTRKTAAPVRAAPPMQRSDLRAHNTVKEIAEYLHCSRNLIYQLMASGELKFVRIGARRRITREAIEAFEAANAAV